MAGPASINIRDEIANRPTASAEYIGTFFIASDEDEKLYYCNATPAWVEVSAGAAAGGTWALASSTASLGTVAQDDHNNLSAYSEVMILLNQITVSSSGFRQVQVSDDNGVSFRASSGDYQHIEEVGSNSAKTAMSAHGTASAAARSGIIVISAFNITAIHIARGSGEATFSNNWFIPGTTALDAIRVKNSAGNLTGGGVYVYGR